jgi:predicted DNA-binding transcriptional regulator AlpA
MIGARLRYRDLVAKGIVGNRSTLKRRITNDGFPPGAMTGPNERSWDEGEVEEWLASRPQALKPVPATGRPRPVGAGRKRKSSIVATNENQTAE